MSNDAKPITTGTETVTVACKLPNGLILRVFDMVETQEAVQGGYRTVKIARPKGNSITIKGYLEKYNPALPPAAVSSSFALTSGVPKDFWELWLSQNADLEAVVKGHIFAADHHNTVKSMTREREDLRSGLEPIDPTVKNGKIETFVAA